MRKWRDFYKNMVSYFTGTQLVKQHKPDTEVKARVFLLNHYFNSATPALKTEAHIYAHEGDLAYQKACMMQQAVRDVDSIYQEYKKLMVVACEDVDQQQLADAKLISLTKIIIKNYPLLGGEFDINSAHKRFISERIHQAIKKYFRAKVIFELVPGNSDKPYVEPYVSPDTTYAILSSMLSSRISPPTFSSMIGWSIVNPLYLISFIVNGIKTICCEYPARGICGLINKLFDNNKNSFLAVGLKIIFAGIFIVGDAIGFTAAKLLSAGGFHETLQTIKIRSNRTVADENTVLNASQLLANQATVKAHFGVVVNIESSHRRQISLGEEVFAPVSPVHHLKSHSTSSIHVAMQITPVHLKKINPVDTTNVAVAEVDVAPLPILVEEQSLPLEASQKPFRFSFG